MARYNAEMRWADTRYYAIKRDDWMKFINRLYKFGRKNPLEEAWQITDKHEQDCWRAYYMAKNRGKNANGCFELPWEWRQFILEEIENNTAEMRIVQVYYIDDYGVKRIIDRVRSDRPLNDVLRARNHLMYDHETGKFIVTQGYSVEELPITE